MDFCWTGSYPRLPHLSPLVAEAAGDLQQFVRGKLERVLGCPSGLQKTGQVRQREEYRPRLDLKRRRNEHNTEKRMRHAVVVTVHHLCGVSERELCRQRMGTVLSLIPTGYTCARQKYVV